MTSPDGVTWTARTAAGNDDSWHSVTYGNGLFVAVSNFTDAVMTSGKQDQILTVNNNIYQGGMSVMGAFNIGTTTATNPFTLVSASGTSLLVIDTFGRLVLGSTTNANIFLNGGSATTSVRDSNSVAIGNQSLIYTSTTSTTLNNIALGYQALMGSSTVLMTGIGNFAAGNGAGRSNTTGSNNTFLGSQTGFGNTTGSDNFFAGSQAGFTNTTAIGNTFMCLS